MRQLSGHGQEGWVYGYDTVHSLLFKVLAIPYTTASGKPLFRLSYIQSIPLQQIAL